MGSPIPVDVYEAALAVLSADDVPGTHNRLANWARLNLPDEYDVRVVAMVVLQRAAVNGTARVCVE